MESENARKKTYATWGILGGKGREMGTRRVLQPKGLVVAHTRRRNGRKSGGRNSVPTDEAAAAR